MCCNFVGLLNQTSNIFCGYLVLRTCQSSGSYLNISTGVFQRLKHRTNKEQRSGLTFHVSAVAQHLPGLCRPHCGMWVVSLLREVAAAVCWRQINVVLQFELVLTQELPVCSCNMWSVRVTEVNLNEVVLRKIIHLTYSVGQPSWSEICS